MKKLSFIVVFIAMFINANVMRADVYSDGITKLLNDNVLSSPMQGQMPQGQDGEKFMGTLVDWMAGYFRQNMNETEFKQMMEFYSDSKITEINQKIITKLGNLNDPELQQILAPSMMKIMQGQEAEDIKAPECSAEFLASFEKYWEISNCEDGIKNAFNGLSQMMSSEVGEQDAPKMIIIKNVLDYIGKNVKNICLIACQKSNVTKEDLDIYNSIGDQSFFPSYQKAETAMMGGLPELMKKITEKFK